MDAFLIVLPVVSTLLSAVAIYFAFRRPAAAPPPPPQKQQPDALALVAVKLAEALCDSRRDAQTWSLKAENRRIVRDATTGQMRLPLSAIAEATSRLDGIGAAPGMTRRNGHAPGVLAEMTTDEIERALRESGSGITTRSPSEE